VNTSSAAAFAGHPVQITDAASQAAVVGFTRSLALALLPRGIRVNAVAPGPVSPPEAVALSYVFLAGREGSCMNGQILHTDGGAGPGG
jgi:NAD(P)-dependent dehydrogenase (short-subunit alcohol dehydrogenase family)